MQFRKVKLRFAPIIIRFDKICFFFMVICHYLHSHNHLGCPLRRYNTASRHMFIFSKIEPGNLNLLSRRPDIIGLNKAVYLCKIYNLVRIHIICSKDFRAYGCDSPAKCISSDSGIALASIHSAFPVVKSMLLNPRKYPLLRQQISFFLRNLIEHAKKCIRIQIMLRAEPCKLRPSPYTEFRIFLLETDKPVSYLFGNRKILLVFEFTGILKYRYAKPYIRACMDAIFYDYSGIGIIGIGKSPIYSFRPSLVKIKDPLRIILIAPQSKDL